MHQNNDFIFNFGHPVLPCRILNVSLGLIFFSRCYSEVVCHDEYLALNSSQVCKLISSDRLTVATEEQVRTLIVNGSPQIRIFDLPGPFLRSMQIRWSFRIALGCEDTASKFPNFLGGRTPPPNPPRGGSGLRRPAPRSVKRVPYFCGLVNHVPVFDSAFFIAEIALFCLILGIFYSTTWTNISAE